MHLPFCATKSVSEIQEHNVNSSPSHTTPRSLKLTVSNPDRHLQVNPPSVLVQTVLSLQASPVAHSSISDYNMRACRYNLQCIFTQIKVML